MDPLGCLSGLNETYWLAETLTNFFLISSFIEVMFSYIVVKLEGAHLPVI